TRPARASPARSWSWPREVRSRIEFSASRRAVAARAHTAARAPASRFRSIPFSWVTRSPGPTTVRFRIRSRASDGSSALRLLLLARLELRRVALEVVEVGRLDAQRPQVGVELPAMVQVLLVGGVQEAARLE